MRETTYRPISLEQITSTAVADPKTATMPNETSAIMVSVQTTDARITFDGTVPDATHGQVFPKALAPVIVPVGPGSTVKVASTAGANSVVNIDYLA